MKYSQLDSSHQFEPVAIESLRPLALLESDQGNSLWSWVAAFNRCQGSLLTAFLLQWLSIAVLKGYAALVRLSATLKSQVYLCNIMLFYLFAIYFSAFSLY